MPTLRHGGVPEVQADSTHSDLGATQRFLDDVFDRAVRLVEDGVAPEVDALLAGHEALRAEVERLIRLAQHVAAGPGARLPAFEGFTVLQELGRGGMGAVYLARQESLGGRPVALKVLPPSAGFSSRARDRFWLKRGRSPNCGIRMWWPCMTSWNRTACARMRWSGWMAFRWRR